MPLPTLHRTPHGGQRTARGEKWWLPFLSAGLAPAALASVSLTHPLKPTPVIAYKTRDGHGFTSCCCVLSIPAYTRQVPIPRTEFKKKPFSGIKSLILEGFAKGSHVTDIVDQKTRSRMMSGIKGKDTKPELAVRRALHLRSFRFRLHSRKVQGRPDLVLPKHRAVVFVDGCFWHRHEGCRFATNPSTRPEFWSAKFAANVTRDTTVRAMLLKDGWRVATVWECALRKPEQVAAAIGLLSTWLLSETDMLEIGEQEVSGPQEKARMTTHSVG